MDQSFTHSSEAILIVDDDPIVLKICATVLARAGYRVITASNGESAIERCQKADHRIELALVDVVMPGMTGVDVANHLRAFGVKSLLMSGCLNDQTLDGLGLHIGPNTFLQKPFTPADLLRVIRQALDAPRVRTQDAY